MYDTITDYASLSFIKLYYYFIGNSQKVHLQLYIKG